MKDFFNFIFSIASLILGVYGIFFHTDLNQNPTVNWLKVLIFSFAIFIVVIVQYHRLMLRYKRYFNAFPKINEAFSIVHSITNPDIDDHSDVEKDLDLLRDFCSKLKCIFDSLSKEQTRVCIKIIANNNNNSHISTLVRHDKELEEEDEEDFLNKKFYWLKENTAFNHIFTEEEGKLRNNYFFCNAIPFAKNYSNSRLIRDENYPPRNLWIKIPLETPVLGDLISLFFWRLNYKSTIIVPIFPLQTLKLGKAKWDSDRDSDLKLEGFLCIDSKSLYAFKKRDLDILHGIADGMYETVRMVRIKGEK